MDIKLKVSESPQTPVSVILKDKMKYRMISRQWKTGDRLPDYRELAVMFKANPQSVIVALEELERKKLLEYNSSVNHFFVTSDKKVIDDLRERYAHEAFAEFMSEMRRIDYPKDKIVSMIVEDKLLFSLEDKNS